MWFLGKKEHFYLFLLFLLAKFSCSSATSGRFRPHFIAAAKHASSFSYFGKLCVVINHNSLLKSGDIVLSIILLPSCER